ncbi:alpha/beta fold hydrolase [Sphingomonas daechungensis]|uniref:alpha/beta fold hydrolase n=1 Tax=Sphingomonas daechungensis TaxID=1176646 RepID=UPI003783D9CD
MRAVRSISTFLILALMLSAASPALAQGRAGTLISAEPIVETPGGMQAWKVRYWTLLGDGRPVQATGIVAAPREAIPAQPRNVLAWTHGTWGVVSKCAPSLSPNFWNATPGLEAVRSGYVVVAPDYPGLGSDGVHPFLVGVDTGRSVLDAVRAARSIPGAAAGSRYAVWGESQGGHAALWTGQISARYAPELQLVGVAAAAPPTDLAQNLRQSANKSVRTFFTAYIGYTWNQRYHASLAPFGGAQSQGILKRLAQNNCIELNSKPKLGTILGVATLQSRWKTLDLGRIEPWASLAHRNSPTTHDFGVPLLIAQNPKDDLVAPAVTLAHSKALCRSGARLKYITISGPGHATSAKDSATETLSWIQDRFAGRPAPSDCRRL